MSVISEDYFQMLLHKSSEYHSVPVYGEVIQPQHDQLRSRVALLFALDCVLDIHRQTNANLWSPLIGREALTHLLLQKYKYSLSEIRSLSLKDSILLMQEELSILNLPKEVVAIIKNFAALTKIQFPELKEDEWDPEFYLTIPKPQNW